MMIEAPSDEDDETLFLSSPETTRPSPLSQANGEIIHTVQTPISPPGLNMTPQSRSAFEPYVLNHIDDSCSPNHGSSARSTLARSSDPSQSSAVTSERFPSSSAHFLVAPPRTSLAPRVSSYREEHVETAGTLLSSASCTDLEESASIRRLRQGGYIGKRSYDPTAVVPRGRNRAHTFTSGVRNRSRESVIFSQSSNSSEGSVPNLSPPSRSKRMLRTERNSSINNTRFDSDITMATALSSSSIDEDEIESYPINSHAPLHQRDGSTGQPTIMTASSTAPTTRFDRFTSWRGVFGMLTVSLNRHNDRATLPRRRTMKVLACIGLYFISICTFLHLPLRNGPFFPSFGSRKLSKPSRKKDVFQFNEDEIGNEKTAGLGFGVGHGREVAFPLAGRVSEESGSDDIKDGAPTSSKKLKAFVFKRKDTTTSIDNFSDHHEYEAYDSSSASGGIGNAPSTSSEIHKSGGRRPSLSHAKASSNEMVFGVSSREVRLTPNGSESNGASGSPKQAVKRFIPPENGARNRMKSEHTSRGWDWSNALRALYKALAWVGFMVLVLETGYQEMTRRFMYLRQRRIRPRTE
mmetsp:Transcript_21479/g.31719  ORF Transcript_21479/g.31719 Transcript_21479/m.31719 type:complete len:578 (-) Transcript_21479:300-2033(-)